MLADKYKVVLVEIGPKGKCSVVSRENGYLFHTNHYVSDCLLSFNKISDISSEKRYARIGTLLKNYPEPYNFEQFLALSNDENDGPDNSIFRTGGNKHKVRTLATWAVTIPAKGYPELYIKLLNPGEKEKIIRIRAEYVFNEVYQGKKLWNL